MMTGLWMLIAAQAMSPDAAPSTVAGFTEFDVNEDGVIERDEAQAKADIDAVGEATILTSREKEGPGKPRKREIGAAPAGIAWFDRADTDRDGRVTPAEWARVKND